MAEEEICSWCEDGNPQCDWTFSNYTQGLFTTSISSELGGRGFPFFYPSSQIPFTVNSPNERITLAVIVHHGAARNGDSYCSYMTNAVLRSGLSLDSTLVIGPQIYEFGDDGLDPDTMIWWNENSDDGIVEDGGERDWKWGGNSTSELPFSISTFSVLDEILLTLADINRYPNLQRIVLAGHSAGGQIIQRYALFSTIGTGGVQSSSLRSDLSISYYVANPSSTTYLDDRRPVTTSVSDRDCQFCVNTTIDSQVWNFEVPDGNSAAAACLDSYNQYGYGLDGLLPDYPASTTVAAARTQYALRDVVYMSGESDVCDVPYMTENSCTECIVDDGGLDTSCGAYAQGWCRMARLHAFSQYVNGVYYEGKDVHGFLSVPHVGHSGCGMFQSAVFAAAALGYVESESKGHVGGGGHDASPGQIAGIVLAVLVSLVLMVLLAGKWYGDKQQQLQQQRGGGMEVNSTSGLAMNPLAMHDEDDDEDDANDRS